MKWTDTLLLFSILLVTLLLLWVGVAFASEENNEEVECLTTALYFESRGELLSGMVAVGEVILNRVDSHHYPDTICGVVKQGGTRKGRGGCQFSFYCDGIEEVYHNTYAKEIAQRVALFMTGEHKRTPSVTMGKGIMFYHADSMTEPPGWTKKMREVANIGGHTFYSH